LIFTKTKKLNQNHILTMTEGMLPGALPGYPPGIYPPGADPFQAAAAAGAAAAQAALAAEQGGNTPTGRGSKRKSRSGRNSPRISGGGKGGGKGGNHNGENVNDSSPMGDENNVKFNEKGQEIEPERSDVLGFLDSLEVADGDKDNQESRLNYCGLFSEMIRNSEFKLIVYN
jgi:hypothetical protein